MTEIVPVVKERASWGKGRIKLIGVGTAGIQVVNHIFKDLPQDVMAICCDTDEEVLNGVASVHKVLLGKESLGGRGCMGDPDKGRIAGEESLGELKKLVKEDTELVFFIAGVGKGTGSGALPVIAENLLADKKDVASIAILLYPFSPAGRRVRQIADKSIEEIKKHVNAVIVIDNDNIVVGDKRIEDILRDRNGFIKNIIQGIIYSSNPGLYFSIKPAELGVLFNKGREAHVGISIQTKIDKPDLDLMFEQISSHPYLKHVLNFKHADAMFVSFLWHPSVDVTGGVVHALRKKLESEGANAEFLLAMGQVSQLPEKSAMLLIIEVSNQAGEYEENEEVKLWEKETKQEAVVSASASGILIEEAGDIVQEEPVQTLNQIPEVNSQGNEQSSVQSREERKKIPAYERFKNNPFLKRMPTLFKTNDDSEDDEEVPRDKTIPYLKDKPD